MDKFLPGMRVKVICAASYKCYNEGAIGRIVSTEEMKSHWSWSIIKGGDTYVFLDGEDMPYIISPSNLELVDKKLNWKKLTEEND